MPMTYRIILILALASAFIMATMPIQAHEPECITDSCVGCIDDCTGE